MKILMIGGTVFLGRHLVRAARQSGHDITIFHRGKHNPGIFPGVKKILGDRKKDISHLNFNWDVVIDTCGYLPEDVEISTSFLKERADRYVFISSISVYRDFKQTGIREDHPGAVLADGSSRKITGATYGPLKFLCEEAVRKNLPGRHLIVRPGLITAPFDPTNRFVYWPWRIFEGGKMIVPGSKERPIQFIDARDLAEWIIRITEERLEGTYNATGPEKPLSMSDLIQAGKSNINPDVELIWVDDRKLLELEVTPWTDLPLWIPEIEDMKGFNRIDNSAAVKAGLVFRKPEISMQQTLEWFQKSNRKGVFSNQKKIEAGILKSLQGESE